MSTQMSMISQNSGLVWHQSIPNYTGNSSLFCFWETWFLMIPSVHKNQNFCPAASVADLKRNSLQGQLPKRITQFFQRGKRGCGEIGLCWCQTNIGFLAQHGYSKPFSAEAVLEVPPGIWQSAFKRWVIGSHKAPDMIEVGACWCHFVLCGFKKWA